MGSNSVPPPPPPKKKKPKKKPLLDESVNRGLVCAHMHFIARTQKILTFMSQTGKCRQQKHTHHAPSTKTKCDYLNGWIKKKKNTVTYAKISPESGGGTQKKKKKKKKKIVTVTGKSRSREEPFST